MNKDDEKQDSQLRISTSSENETALLGARIGAVLPGGFVLALNGTLGAGKTRLTQSIIEQFGIDPINIVSPTYTICIPHRGRITVLHLDAYRIKDLKEVDELGLDESVDDGALLIIEWAEKIETALPPIDLDIRITAEGETERKFTFDARSKRGHEVITALQIP